MLARPPSAILWELRSAWAAGRRVALSLEGCDVARVEGPVQRVAASGAYVVVDGRHVPSARVLAVHRPSLLAGAAVRGAGAAAGGHGPDDGPAPQRERLPLEA